MASFVDPDDQTPPFWETATEFEALRMMCLCLASDPEAQYHANPAFPCEALFKHTTMSNFMSHYWHGRLRHGTRA